MLKFEEIHGFFLQIGSRYWKYAQELSGVGNYLKRIIIVCFKVLTQTKVERNENCSFQTNAALTGGETSKTNPNEPNPKNKLRIRTKKQTMPNRNLSFLQKSYKFLRSSSGKIKFLDFKYRHDFRFPVDPASWKMSKKISAKIILVQFHSTFSVRGIKCCKLGFFHFFPRICTFNDISELFCKFFKLGCFCISTQIRYIWKRLRLFCKFEKFFFYFSTNWHIWKHLWLFFKFQKCANFANLDFSVFLRESAHFAMFEII